MKLQTCTQIPPVKFEDMLQWPSSNLWKYFDSGHRNDSLL